jgi:hypothetical protein
MSAENHLTVEADMATLSFVVIICRFDNGAGNYGTKKFHV